MLKGASDEVIKEWKRKISNSTKGENNHYFGKKHTEETKAKMRKSWRNKNRDIICITTNKTFKDATEAKIYGNLKNTESIYKNCKFKTITEGENDYGKLQWMFLDEYLKYGNLHIKFDKENENFTKVVCIETGEIYDSIKEASNKFITNEENIRSVCNRKSKRAFSNKYNKYFSWIYYKDYINKEKLNEHIEYINSKGKIKKEVIVFKDDKYIGTFESALYLEKNSIELFNIKLLSSEISKVCNNKAKQHKGYVFKFKK